MERLTKKFTDGTFYCEDVEDVGIVGINSPTYVGKTVNKLADYEDAEEQGLLLRLPCRFGDTMWWIAPNSGGEPSMVLDTKFDESMISRLDLFGKVFFTSKEEAEQALKQMGE